MLHRMQPPFNVIVPNDPSYWTEAEFELRIRRFSKKLNLQVSHEFVVSALSRGAFSLDREGDAVILDSDRWPGELVGLLTHQDPNWAL